MDNVLEVSEAEDCNDGHLVEGLDRLHIVMCLIDDHVVDHPAIKKAGVAHNIESALDLIMDAYQAVGRVELDSSK